jgi:hypothetical protein
MRNDFYDEVNVDQYHTFEGAGGTGRSNQDPTLMGQDQRSIEDAAHERR